MGAAAHRAQLNMGDGIAAAAVALRRSRWRSGKKKKAALAKQWQA
jgi:uncharacterized protein with PIN domain